MTINFNSTLNEMAADSILILATEHKKNCNGQCSVSLFPLRSVIEKLKNRNLTEEELKILS